MTPLRQALQEYLALRRSLGFQLRAAGNSLHQFVRFMDQHRAASITQALALAWAQAPASPVQRGHRLTFVRGFARYCSATDPRTQVPPPGLLPFRPRRVRPYLYSAAELRDLLAAARQLPVRSARERLRPWVYYCLFGLLSVTGLRVGEACNLTLPDVDLTAGVLTIRGAKFGKSRLVPLHASTCTVLAAYLARRQQHCAGRVVSDHLFVSSRGSRLNTTGVDRTFRALARQIGLRGATARRAPRLHDLRHRFATNTLVRWYRAGHDPARRLPILSAYLGHAHVANTQWYLEASPALMRAAMRRLERRWEARP